MAAAVSDAADHEATDVDDDDEWLAEAPVDEEEQYDEDDELLGPRALPVDGEPDFDSVRRDRRRRARSPCPALTHRPRLGVVRRDRLPTVSSTCAACAGRRRSAPA